MYLETRYYDNGTARARLHKGFSYPKLEDVTDCDRYIESIGDSDERVIADYGNSSDYTTLEDWIEQLTIELDDIVPLVLALDTGEWVDITPYT